MSAAKLQRKPTEPYQQSIDEVLAGLNTDPRLGLSEAEARAIEHGDIEICKTYPGFEVDLYITAAFLQQAFSTASLSFGDWGKDQLVADPCDDILGLAHPA